jgi:hypothetical protein
MENKELAVLHCVEDIIFRLDAKIIKPKFTENFPLSAIKRAEMLGLSDTIDELRPNDFISVGTFFDIDCKMNYGLATFPVEDCDRYLIQHVSNATLQEVRGRISTFTKYILKNRVLFLTEKNEIMKETLYVGSNDGFKWQDIGMKKANGQTRDTYSSEYWTKKIGSFSGATFEQHYYWYVDICYKDNIELSFVTSPGGAKEIFRLRDIPNGKERRVALRNWVAEHFRKSKIDPEESIKVRQHLRGGVEFDWNGLHIRIRPSEEDIILNERLACERQNVGAK